MRTILEQTTHQNFTTQDKTEPGIQHKMTWEKRAISPQIISELCKNILKKYFLSEKSDKSEKVQQLMDWAALFVVAKSDLNSSSLWYSKKQAWRKCLYVFCHHSSSLFWVSWQVGILFNINQTFYQTYQQISFNATCQSDIYTPCRGRLTFFEEWRYTTGLQKRIFNK